MVRGVSVAVIGLCCGFLFDQLHIPAGWLLGSLLFGIIYGLSRSDVHYDGLPFKLALTLVGANIGIMMDRSLFGILGTYFLPLFAVLLLTFLGSFLLARLLYRWAPSLGKRTAFFCCIPGGASEIISLSGDYGADSRIVAAFHTARITFFVLLIPLAASLWKDPVSVPADNSSAILTGEHLLIFTIVIGAAILLNNILTIPAGALLYSILIGFFLGEFIFEIQEAPAYAGAIGQGLIGVMVGVRFDRETFLRLRQSGFISAKIIFLFLLLGFVSAGVFYLFTDTSYAVSLLSIIPAGAAEMSATAYALGLAPTLVASLQIIRVISIFLALPFLLKIIERME
ncbi:AbrB family transcriptional regulator [Alkalicoccus halolimnae]|uniref:AbrB family transcriptional regulator n=1 Tax=Alkalicoccus halolimnae TaxID=1667239 RepID=A0A5C7FJ83_9BACI|nr:AbrB family transcriptional regulator [Alkalicoccus halolimnae]TXF84616.1 AbrB family transcriptional regulator [Alkalicoccus halolimnae]